MPNDIVIIPGSKVITFQDGNNTVQRLSITGSGLKFTGAITSSKLSITNNLIIDGNLGIGTSNPAKLFDVRGATASGQYVSTTGTNISFHAFSNTGGGVLVGKEGSAGSAVFLGTSPYSAVFGTDSAYPIGFATNNTEVVRITTSGSVGIGTNSPTKLLQVNGDSLIYANVAGAVNSNKLIFGSFANNAAGAIYAQTTTATTGDLILASVISSTITERVRINKDGNVGIGTSSPTQRLDLSGSLRIKSSGTYSDPVDNAGFLNYDAQGGVFTISARSSGGSTYMAFRTSNSGTAGERMRINSDGNVGINTSTPGAKLEIYGGLLSSTNASTLNLATFTSIVSNASYLKIFNKRFATGGDWTTAATRIQQVIDVTDQAYIDFNPSGSSYGIGFGTGATTPTQKMVINIDGNVGIGTTSPVGKLDVRPDSSWLGSEAFIVDTDSGNNPRIRLYRPDGVSATTAYPIHIRNDSGNLNILTGNTAVLGSETVTSKFYFSTAGNLGIGTTSPRGGLHINTINGSSGNEYQGLVVSATISSSRGVNIAYDATNDVGVIQPVHNGTAWKNLVLNPSGASVSVGSGAAYQKLSVQGAIEAGVNTSTTGGPAYYIRYSGGTSDYINSIGSEYSSGAMILGFGVTGKSNAAGFVSTFDNFTGHRSALIVGNGLLEFKNSRASLNTAVNSTVPMTSSFKIDADGLVGIGTSSPTYLLDIYKTSNDAIARVRTTTAGAYLFLDSATDGYFGTRLVANGTEKWFLGGYGTSDLQIKRGTAYDGTEVVRVTTTGNVGIGNTVFPSSVKLTVVGGVFINSARTGTGSEIPLIFGSQYFNGAGDRGYAGIYHVESGNSGFGQAASLVIKTSTDDAAPLERMRIAYNGNVGIGTSSPSTLLHINGSTTAGGNILFTSEYNNLSFPTALTYSGGITADDGNYKRLSLYHGYAINFIIGNSATFANSKMLLDSNGNLGIGTYVPSGKLHVTSSTSVPSALLMGGNVGIGTLTPNGPLHIFLPENQRLVVQGYYSVGDSKTGILFGDSQSSQRAAIDVGILSGGGGYLQFLTATNSSTLTLKERARINIDGNLGIGTTSPTQRLHVSGSFRVEGGVYDSNNSLGTSASVLTTTGTKVRWVPVSSGASFSGTTNRLVKFTSATTIGDTTTPIFESGSRLGIGTTSPAAKLEVSGSVLDYQSFNRRTGNYTMSLSDASKLIEMNVGTANTVNVPTNAQVAFRIGTKVDIVQYGAGQTTITASGGSGVQIRTANNYYKINSRYGAATLTKVGTNEWYMFGNLTP